MKQLTQDQQEEVSLRFEALWEYRKKIEAHKEEISMLTSSMTDTFRALTENLEVEPKPLKKAFKEWLEKKKDKDSYDEKEEILLLLTEVLEKK